MVNKQRIRETLNFQDLTEEEKQRRGILGRLYGPCASIVDATRNGRCYGDELWENVFNKNEIVKEMFENGGIPMELDHPVDREETDSQRIAAMLPEPPKRDKDGHLICYVDLIDTPCGKIAYQLAKYGFKLGISSRGSGDVRADDTVDPDTYDFTTFDLVLLPAVKDARLAMCESVDTKNLKFKKALKESYESLASEAEKNIMKEMVEKLDINVSLEEDVNEDKEISDGDYEVELKPMTEAAEEEVVEEEPTEETSENETEEKNPTVKDLLDSFKDFDKDLEVIYGQVAVGDNEVAINGITFDDSEDGKLVVNFDYVPVEGNNIDEVENAEDETEAEEVEVTADEEIIEEEIKSEEVTDSESEEVIENLKEAIRQKDLLENEVKDLKSSKAVSDAEVKKLKEELDRYKLAYARTSNIAANAKQAEAEVKSLTEQLNQKDTEIKELKTKQSQADTKSLKESINDANNKVLVLAERLKASEKEVETKDNLLNEQANVYKQKLIEKIEVAKKYKAQAESALSEYIKFRASMLGVQPKEITSKLNESYTIADINSVCDSILDCGMPSMPYSFGKDVKVKINESKANKPADDDGFDDLLVLAGLK